MFLTVNSDLNLRTRLLNRQRRRSARRKCLRDNRAVSAITYTIRFVGVDGPAVGGGRVVEADRVLGAASGRDLVLVFLIAVGVGRGRPIDGVGEDLGSGLEEGAGCWCSGGQGEQGCEGEEMHFDLLAERAWLTEEVIFG